MSSTAHRPSSLVKDLQPLSSFHLFHLSLLFLHFPFLHFCSLPFIFFPPYTSLNCSSYFFFLPSPSVISHPIIWNNAVCYCSCFFPFAFRAVGFAKIFTLAIERERERADFRFTSWWQPGTEQSLVSNKNRTHSIRLGNLQLSWSFLFFIFLWHHSERPNPSERDETMQKQIFHLTPCRALESGNCWMINKNHGVGERKNTTADELQCSTSPTTDPPTSPKINCLS